MKDLTEYSDDELALTVFNDEQLYLQCCEVHKLAELKIVLARVFKFTETQWVMLADRLEAIDASGDYKQFATWGGSNE